jgi:hypothetical protein
MGCIRASSFSLGETVSASCFGGIICRGPGDRALALPPETGVTLIGPDDSWEEHGTSTGRAVGMAALVLWEASPLRRRKPPRSSVLF